MKYFDVLLVAGIIFALLLGKDKIDLIIGQKFAVAESKAK